MEADQKMDAATIAAAATATAPAPAAATVWSISVKTVGGEYLSSAAASPLSSSSDSAFWSRDFTIQVSPDDQLSSLYERIEGVTGLAASQQRLIYRGRLIGGSGGGGGGEPAVSVTKHDTSDNTTGGLDASDKTTRGLGGVKSQESLPRIKDIVGLHDGQTIHLVRKRDTAEHTGANSALAQSPRSSTALPSPTNSDDDNTSSPDQLSGLGTGTLLGALLGMGMNPNASDDSSEETIAARRRWRASRAGRRRPQYRLSAEDLEIRDPGSMESVRQGIMTLHTMLPHAEQTGAASDEEDVPTPLEAPRRWYRGQWIDCRDTVNQWLEATVVEIVHPHDLLPPRAESAPLALSSPSTSPHPADDPAVSAWDLEGRRRLLLEPCDDGECDEGGELAGYKRRATNHGVQLLLIHYNGWPHRWDEWIRGDSERIRPFRVRTRHPNSSNHACPTPQATFTEAPSTSICSENDSQDREALLPELCRVIASVQDLLSSAASRAATSSRTDHAMEPELPWAIHHDNDTATADVSDPLLFPDETILESAESSPVRAQVMERKLQRRELEVLAPLLDRLGRTLVDAAPHVAALAGSLPLSRSNQDDAVDSDEAIRRPSTSDHPHTLGGLLSLLGRDRRRQSTASSNAAVVGGDTASTSMSNGTSEGSPTVLELRSGMDPDHTDYVTGFVNTTRGEVRTGPRGRTNSSSSNDDVASLLGAYLAAASLGSLMSGSNDDGDDGIGNTGGIQALSRLLRDRSGGGSSGGGGGIDIHIHAVVTAPGTGPGNVGLAMGGVVGGGLLNARPMPTATPVGSLVSSRRDYRDGDPNPIRAARLPVVISQDDDMGIFSDLYSENPDPVNFNRFVDANVSSSSTSDPASSETPMQSSNRSNAIVTAATHSSRSQSRSTSRSRSLSRHHGRHCRHRSSRSAATASSILSSQQQEQPSISSRSVSNNNPSTNRSRGGAGTTGGGMNLLSRFFRRTMSSSSPSPSSSSTTTSSHHG